MRTLAYGATVFLILMAACLAYASYTAATVNLPAAVLLCALLAAGLAALERRR
jgi:hypothetical protein